MLRLRHTLLVSLVALSSLLGACGMGQSPRVDVVSATLDDATDDAASIDVGLRLSNPNDEPLPLIEFEYTVSLDGDRVYEGRHAALATLSTGDERTLTVPAVVMYEHTAWRAGTGPPWQVEVAGTLRYRTPGTIADLLFDFGVRKPKVRFAGEVQLVR